MIHLAKEHIGQNGRIRILLLEGLQEPIDTSLVVSTTVLVVPKGLASLVTDDESGLAGLVSWINILKPISTQLRIILQVTMPIPLSQSQGRYRQRVWPMPRPATYLATRQAHQDV